MIFQKTIFRLTFCCFFFCAIYSCTDQRLANQSETLSIPTTAGSEDNLTTSTVSPFNRYVGAPIDRETALRWKANFLKAKPSNAGSEYFIKATTLSKILSAKNCVGISLYYGVDESGKLIIVPIGIDGNGKAIMSETIEVDQILDWRTAWSCIDRYQGAVKAQFSGADSYNRILVDQRAEVVRLSMSIDNAGQPKILMSDASVVDSSLYEDHSFPCPPVCPQ